jgi:hypothetical protein
MLNVMIVDIINEWLSDLKEYPISALVILTMAIICNATAFVIRENAACARHAMILSICMALCVSIISVLGEFINEGYPRGPDDVRILFEVLCIIPPTNIVLVVFAFAINKTNNVNLSTLLVFTVLIIHLLMLVAIHGFTVNVRQW